VPHFTTAVLEAGLDRVRESPWDNGTVELIVRRPAVDEREALIEATLDLRHGLVGDTWQDRVGRSGAPDPERRELAGDQLYVDLDIGVANLPAGARLMVGAAVIEVTEPPHRGCLKFAARFGEDALRFVNSPVGRELRLRGMNARVVVAGTVRPGDTIRKLL
jgi:hypothetical protein